ncbi:MAG: hypothetical protein ABIP06_03090 [Pyrinomonadaceae bacterium]
MWICRNCKTENEDNFRFCWSCGQTSEKSKPAETQNVIEDMLKKPEFKKETIREIKSVEEIKPKSEHKPIEEIKLAEVTNVEKRNPPKTEAELFSTVLPSSKKSFASDDETNWEIKIFRIAVRLAGLFLVYQFIVALPDLMILINWEAKHDNEFSDALVKEFVTPVAKNLFYLIVGIYLIASGRILLWLLPRQQ